MRMYYAIDNVYDETTKMHFKTQRNDVELLKDFGSVVRKCREGPCGSPIWK